MLKESQSVSSRYEPPCRIIKTIERFKYGKGKNPEIWGFATVNGLLLCFRAWHAFHVPGRNTNWYPHAPYNPLEIIHHLDEEDAAYILAKLGVQTESIEDYKKKCIESLRERKSEYDDFRNRYNNDKSLQESFGTAISLKCDEIEKNMVL